jgi:hypothetical protein
MIVSIWNILGMSFFDVYWATMLKRLVYNILLQVHIHER